MHAEDGAETVADLPEGHGRLHGIDDESHEVLRPASAALQCVERSPGRVAVTGGAQPADALGERLAQTGLELEEVGRALLVRDELVDADDDAPLVLDLALVAVGRVLDLPLHEADG